LDAGTLPRVDEVGLDWAALSFAIGTSIVTALILGLATGARLGQNDLRGLISNDGRTLTGGVRSQRVRDLLVVAQVALTIVLVMGAGLLGRSFLRVLSVDPGYSTEDALVLDMALGSTNDPAQMQRQTAFQTTLMERLRSLPGVTSVGIINDFPLGGGNYANGQFLEMNSPTEIQTFEDFRKLTPAEQKQRGGYAGFRIASEDYFDAMGIALVRGRLFTSGDGPDAPHVAVISESLVKAKWPDQDPIGRFIQFGNMDGDMRALRIVGVVRDIREFGPEALPAPLLYASYRQRPGSISSFSTVVRGPEPAAITLAATQIVRQLDAQLPVNARTVSQAFDRSFAGRRFSLLVIGLFGVVAVALATLGLYGVIAYLVAQRTREIGIRTVLGAPARDLMSMVVGKGTRLAVYGTILGFALYAALLKTAGAFTTLLGDLLFGITVGDAASLALTLAVIAAAVACATAIPARRALRVSPMVALRNE
jgi:predicted permease